METQILPSKYDGKHALNCLEQEIRQMQGGKITCKQKGKILLIEKELKVIDILKKSLVEMSNTKELMGEYYRAVLVLDQEEYELLKEVLL